MTAKSSTVAILLATYNGAEFIKEQLTSFLDQTHTDWHLFISDDGSSDDTLTVIKTTLSAERFTLLPLVKNTLGSSGNFARLLQHSEVANYPYIALSDQDDIWKPNKLEILFRAINTQSEQPQLAHADLDLIDATGKKTADSFINVQKLSPNTAEPLQQLLVQNYIPGCTMLFNQQLLEKVTPIPNLPRVHDWWIALTAATTGNIHFSPQIIGSYRQHDNNVIGAVNVTTALRTKTKGIKKLWKTGLENLTTSFKLAEALNQRFPDNRNIQNYLRIAAIKPWKRPLHTQQQAFKAQSRLRQALFLARLPFI